MTTVPGWPLPEETLSFLAMVHERCKNPAPHPEAPAGWLRDKWNTTCFGPPFCTPDTSLHCQAHWASKKATVAIHRAFKNGTWADIHVLTVSLAICDRVLQLCVAFDQLIN